MKGLTSFEKNVICRAAVGDMLVRSAVRYPEKRMFRFHDEFYLSWEFNESVNRCAHGLAKRGIKGGPGGHPVPQLPPVYDLLVGPDENRRHYHPLNFMLKKDEIKYIINHAEPRIFVVEDALIPNVAGIRSDLKSVKHLYSINLTGAALPAD